MGPMSYYEKRRQGEFAAVMHMVLQAEIFFVLQQEALLPILTMEEKSAIPFIP